MLLGLSCRRYGETIRPVVALSGIGLELRNALNCNEDSTGECSVPSNLVSRLGNLENSFSLDSDISLVSDRQFFSFGNRDSALTQTEKDSITQYLRDEKGITFSSYCEDIVQNSNIADQDTFLSNCMGIMEEFLFTPGVYFDKETGNFEFCDVPENQLDTACCSEASSCVYNGQCYDVAQPIGDRDDDGVDEICI
jgi:hypothetical protein